MTPQEFLGAVLPSSGRFCIVGIDKSRAKAKVVHKYSTTTDNAALDVADLLKQQYNVFYTTAGMGAIDSRVAQNTVSKRELYIDIDCGEGKPYETPKEGSVALRKFLEDTKLPNPTVIFSGNGLHAHWYFTESVDCLSWHSVATRLKKLCVAHQFDVDLMVMADYVRILRVPDTINLRGGGEVKLLNKVKHYEFALLKSIIGEDAQDMFEQARKLQGKTELDESTKALMGNRVSKYETILIKSLNGSGCAQVKHAYENAATLSEPLWRANLSQAQVCIDRDWAIHEISKDHPGYDALATETKADLTQGPHTCETFQKMETGSLCTGCSYIGKIKAPVQIGVQIERAPEQEVVEEVIGSEGTTKQYEIPRFPFPYFRGKNGGVYRTTLSDKEGEEKEKDDLVYPHDIYVYRRMVDPEIGDTVWIRLHLPRDGVREFMVPQTALMSVDKFRDVISSKGVTAHIPKQVQVLQHFIVRMVEELQHLEKAKDMHARFGWTKDDSFIVGDREYRHDGVFHAPPAANLAKLAGYMQVVGSLEAWSKMVSFYERPGMEAHAFAVFAGFGSLLMHSTNEGSSLVNLQSNASGTGKTTALLVVNSIFGHPKGLLLNASDTLMSKVHRMGTMSALSTTIDEITNMSGEQASDFMYGITNGRGRNRMSSKENTERVNYTEWANITVSTSNSSMVDKLRGNKDDPQGELARLLELRVETIKDVTPAEAEENFSLVNTNYGVAGDLYVKYLVANPIEVNRIFLEVKHKIIKHFGFSGPERYHANTITCAFAGAVIAKQLGLFDLDIGKVIKWMIQRYKETRAIIAAAKGDPESAISGFINENRNNVLIIDSLVRKGTLINVPRLEPKGNLLVRWEPDTDMLYILQSPFVKWAANNQVNLREVIDDIQTIYGITMVATKKRMGKGTSLDIGAARVYEIPFAKARLGISIEDAANEPQEEQASH